MKESEGDGEQLRENERFFQQIQSYLCSQDPKLSVLVSVLSVLHSFFSCTFRIYPLNFSAKINVLPFKRLVFLHSFHDFVPFSRIQEDKSLFLRC